MCNIGNEDGEAIYILENNGKLMCERKTEPLCLPSTEGGCLGNLRSSRACLVPLLPYARLRTEKCMY